MQDVRRHPFRWPLSIDAVWLVMPVFVVAIRTLLQPIPMEDYWWHLVMGRLIDAGTLPSTNMYLFTLPVDAPFYNQPWLAQWLMYLVAEYLGHVAIVLVHSTLLVAAFAGIVGAAFRRGAAPVTVGIMGALAYYISASTLMPRTQMFAYPLFCVLAVGLLELSRPELNGRARWAISLTLCAVAAFWANVHGTFVLAIVLTVATGAGSLLERKRRGDTIEASRLLGWAALVLAVCGATAIAPGGFDNFIYPFAILLATKGHAGVVLEWQSPDPATLAGGLFYLSLVFSAYVLWRRRSRVSLEELALLAPLTVIAVGSVRGVFWWALAAVLIVAPHLTALRAAPPRIAPTLREARINAGLLATFVVATALTLPGGPVFRAVDPAALFGDGRMTQEDDGAVLSQLNPSGLIPFLKDLEGHHIFHHQALGGFMQWTLTTAERPAPVTFVDQRLELIPGKLWDDYFTISKTREGWDELVEHYGISAFVVDAGEQGPLAEHLEASELYVLVAQDRAWRLYARRDIVDR